MSQPQTIHDIIENLEEQKRLFENLLQEDLPTEIFGKLLATIVSANDRAQILLDIVVGHSAVQDVPALTRSVRGDTTALAEYDR